MRMEVKRVMVDGEFVVLHCHVRFTEEDRGMAVADILRIQDGRMVEHREVGRPIPEEDANGNGMF
jgi:predicted SnoaL-like aldol condensation-catalyzing enzyme